jgi:hypothetical protein
MQTMSLNEAIAIAEKIDLGRHDLSTLDSRFSPLWRHPFLREVYLCLLQTCAEGVWADFERDNFENTCAILCPEFANILDAIDLPALTPSSAALYEVTDVGPPPQGAR